MITLILKGNTKFQSQVTENKDVNYFPSRLKISSIDSFTERRSCGPWFKVPFLDPRIQSVQLLISQILELCPLLFSSRFPCWSGLFSLCFWQIMPVLSRASWPLFIPCVLWYSGKAELLITSADAMPWEAGVNEKEGGNLQTC